MKTAGTVILLISCASAAISGCRRESAPQRASGGAASAGELKIQEALGAVSDWRFMLGDNAKSMAIWSTISSELFRMDDRAARRKYISRLAEIVFAYPLDATDPGSEGFRYPLDATAPGTRKEQWFAFCEMSYFASSKAYGFDEMDLCWEIRLRRLKRIKDEMRIVEAYLDGKGGKETFTGDRDSWLDYYRWVKGEYNNCDRVCSRSFGDLKTAYGLTYEKWSSIRSRLEEALGHKVNVWSSVLEHWERKRKKKDVPEKAATGAARPMPPYRLYDRLIRDLFFLDARGPAGKWKFGWRVERDVQGRTDAARQAQGVN